ncbi:sensor histidine kinase [Acinetobacter tjernbergiae]|uniref:histidine kinase n=1 Tax=Acinetobacter tjernbergiae DSM 14971 = CIP 107465 TaxID=1120928 RepID=V2WA72_9GAMM|nr:two-component sensor histidine kinase [Acinetobacter tjernbergiae]ESK56899.1 hypothetical protein F990_00667 [Acinetobacter tjernbergiae DSM 14971 = CIP 107465]
MIKTPFVVMWGILLVGIALTLLTVITALYQPWFGFTLVVEKQHIVVDTIGVPLVGVQHGEIVQSISHADGGNRAELVEQDIMEDPDQLETYQQSRQFFHRQDYLASLLQQQQIGMQFANGNSILLDVQPRRPMNSLPVVFWVQIFVGLSSFLIGGWVWGISRKRYTTFILFIAGCCIMAAAFSAAIYSSRVLALPAPLFELLSNLNHTSAMLFGVVLVLLFANYPTVRLLPSRLQLLFVVVTFCWWLCDMFKVFFSGPPIGTFVPLLIALSIILLLSCWQYRRAKYDPVAQAALRWFALSLMLGAGIPVLLVSMPNLLGIDAAMSQGYAFLFFLLIYVGVVQGVLRYRLFELESWIFRILFYLLGFFLLILVDTFLVMMLSPRMSLSLAILICGLIWLPIRGWLQARLLQSKKLSDSELFERILQMSFAINEQERQLQWKVLLNDLFQPLKLEIGEQTHHSQIEDNGLVLHTPQVAGLAAMRLSYAQQGRRLFNEHDQQLIQNLLPFLAQAVESRVAYDQGVREERHRIARDLHDDLGAKLLSGLYQKDAEQMKQTIRQAIAEMRMIVNGLLGAGVELKVVLHELEQEIKPRLHNCDIAFIWIQDIGDQPISLSYSQYRHYISMMREIISNIIKYANAHQVSIQIYLDTSNLYSVVCDDGQGCETNLNETIYGNGLKNLNERAVQLSARLDLQLGQGEKGSKITISFPV